MAVKSLKLTNEKRDHILKNVMEHWDKNNPFLFEGEEIDTKEYTTALEYQIAEEYYSMAFGHLSDRLTDPEIQKFLSRDTGFLIEVNGCMVGYHIEKEKPLPLKEKSSWSKPCILVVDKPIEKQIRLDEIHKARNKWFDARDKMAEEVQSILCSVNTTKQLIEVWAEIEEFFPPYLADPSKGIQLPAIVVTGVNEKLGLGGSK